MSSEVFIISVNYFTIDVTFCIYIQTYGNMRLFVIILSPEFYTFIS